MSDAPKDWNPIGANSPPPVDSPMTRPDASGFAAVTPRQPAAGIVWAPEQWASYGAANWKPGTCFVCGASVKDFNHAACQPSIAAYRQAHAADPSPPPFPPRPSIDQYRFPGKVGNSRNSADSADSAEVNPLDRTGDGRRFDMVAEVTDGALIDAVAEVGVIIRPIDIGGERRFGADVDGMKPVASDHFPTWRAAALAGLARARGAGNEFKR